MKVISQLREDPMSLNSRLAVVFFLFCLLSLGVACGGGADDGGTAMDDDSADDDAADDNDSEADDNACGC
jgi:hypothetical protein